MNFLSESLMARIKKQVKDQLPQILPEEVSNFAPPMIEALIKESRDEVTLAKVSSQPHSTYEAAATLTEFKLKKILLEKMEKSESYMAAPEHRDCYDNKDKDEDPSAGSDRGLKKRKTSKDAEPTKIKIQHSNMPQDQEGNLGDNDDEPRKETASRHDCFKKPTPPQEPTDPDWYVGKTTQEGPTQNWLMTLAASTSTDKSLKDFDELMSTPIDFSRYILNGLKIKNLTQEILLGPAFKLLKGTRSNFAELEYDFEECYKALSEKLDWENPEGGNYPFDLSKPLPLITRRKHQRVPFEYFIKNDLKYLQGGVSTMTYTTSTTKTKAAQYDLPGIEDKREQRKSFYAYARGMQLKGDVYSTKRILAVTHVKVMRKHGYGDGTLTRLLSSLKDITKNIDMEYLPKRRWSTLENKRAHFMIKDINKLLKERRTNVEFGRILWRFDTSAGNIVKEILLKLNIPDHGSILTDSKVTPTNHRRMTKPYSSPRFIAKRFNIGYLKMEVKRQSVKVKEIQERCIIKAFQDYQIKKGMSMSVQKSQVHEMAKSIRWRNKIMLG
ncbi:hypothetical protein Tco_0295968 [Tanacetum coccineum]